MKIFCSVIISMIVGSGYAQALFVPNGTSGIVSSYNGNVAIFGSNLGIGTTIPSHKLEVVGSGTVLNISNYLDMDFNVTLSAPGATIKRSILGTSGNRMSLAVGNNNEHLTIIDGGNVGIGTITPDAKLSVNGQIHATEVKVTATVPGPDYVFEESYSLPSLEEVKSYIDENKHLPEVPSAKEMEKNGINLSEMNMLLLKKVEELTLYILQQESRIKTLEEKIKD